MSTFLISYITSGNGVGRSFKEHTGPVDEQAIIQWEHEVRQRANCQDCAITGFVELGCVVNREFTTDPKAPLVEALRQCVTSMLDSGYSKDSVVIRAAALQLAAHQYGSTSPAASDVLAERQRQISAEGWTPEHDDEYDPGTLAAAAAAYTLHAADHLNPYSQGDGGDEAPVMWPWVPASTWKPTTPRRDLVKAGALIIAEIERLDRTASLGGGKN